MVIFLLAAMLAGFGGAWLQEQTRGEPSISQAAKITTSESRLISEIVKTVGPSVVSVNVNIETEQPTGLFNIGGSSEAAAAGTGIIISKSGYIMTNRHVVPEGTTSVSVTLSDGTEIKDVSVVGRTSSNDNLDVAFLKVNDAKGQDLKPAVIGDSSTIQAGDDVVAIGNALGQFQNSVTSGIVSGFGRSVVAGDSGGNSTESLNDMIQTDAAINEGNSGGPLVNLNGQVIGMNTAVAGNGAENVGFAIPVNNVRGMIDQVLKSGEFKRPYLGVRYVSVTADVAKQFDLRVRDGAFIVPSSDESGPSIITGGPASKAGLQEKDVITAVDGKKVDQRQSLSSLLGVHKPGDKITLTVQRGGESLKIVATLGTL